MTLEENEFTTTTFLEKLKKEFGQKINGEEFNSNDIAQYLIRKFTPYRYGHYPIYLRSVEGVRIIVLGSEAVIKSSRINKREKVKK